MSSSVLISGTLAAAAKKHFSVARGEGPATVFQNGLQAAETVTVQMLTAQISGDPDETDDSQWTTINDGSGALALTATITRLVLTAPGDYRLLTSASTSGAVRIGVMQ